MRYRLAGGIITLLAVLPLVGGCGETFSGMPDEDGTRPVALSTKRGDDPALYQATIEAALFGVSVEEFQRRNDVIALFDGLSAELEMSESATFGGFWIQHEDPFCLVVVFTENGEETIAHYVPAENLQYLDVRTVTYSYAELLAVQQSFGEALRGLDIKFDSATYVTENHVEFRVEDRDLLDAAVTAEKLVIPDCVVIKVGPLATPDI